MTSIKLIVTGASARAEVDGLLTSGMVGIPVTITYDSAWDGLTKALVCRGGSVIRTIMDVGDAATVPHECMIANATLQIGVEGRNADGTLVIPTVWARCGLICSGANADADPSTDPTLPVWAQIQAMIGNLDDLETDPTVPEWAKQPQKPTYTATEVGAISHGDLQEATNEALAQAKASGEFDGADGQDGQDGAPGHDGITPTIGENGNWYLGDTDTGKPSRGATAWSEITDKPFNTIDGNTLVNRSGALCVNTTDDAEQDNTRPITSSGVHVICGNINALLQAI